MSIVQHKKECSLSGWPKDNLRLRPLPFAKMLEGEETWVVLLSELLPYYAPIFDRRVRQRCARLCRRPVAGLG